jgi:hypothetical protein
MPTDLWTWEDYDGEQPPLDGSVPITAMRGILILTDYPDPNWAIPDFESVHGPFKREIEEPEGQPADDFNDRLVERVLMDIAQRKSPDVPATPPPSI